MHKIGLIINPVAGIGGRAGLKGSDGADIQRKASEAGFQSPSGERAARALERLSDLRKELTILAFPAEMGARQAADAGYDVVVIGDIDPGNTTADDTMRAAAFMAEADVDLIVFAGGDGTARNICAAVGRDVPIIGVPSGVKMHSSVYAINPMRAGDIVRQYLTNAEKVLTDGEVMDLDEEEYRRKAVRAKLYGYLRVPSAGSLVQKRKVGSSYSQDRQLEFLGNMIADRMKSGVLYLVGPGSSTTYVMGALGLPNTLLGVDLVADRKLIVSDADEKEIWKAMQDYDIFEMIVTVIGGQGYLFGRGNQQISPRIIRKIGKKGIRVIADKQKLTELYPNPFLVDTGDPELDKALCGYIRVPQGRSQDIMFRVDC